MKKTLIALLLFVSMSSAAFAQTAITTTTITEPVTTASPTSIVLTVAATTGMAVNGVLYLDGSVYRIQAISSLLVTVINTYAPATHLDDAVVYIVPLGAQVGRNPVGSCIRGTAGSVPAYSPYTIMFNLSTGDLSMCRGNLGSRTWQSMNLYTPLQTRLPVVTP